MARKTQRVRQGDRTTQATVRAAEISMSGAVRAALIARTGTVRAAKINATAVVIAALVAGSCAVIGVGVQGHFATEQARIAASAKTAEVLVLTQEEIDDWTNIATARTVSSITGIPQEVLQVPHYLKTGRDPILIWTQR